MRHRNRGGPLKLKRAVVSELARAGPDVMTGADAVPCAAAPDGATSKSATAAARRLLFQPSSITAPSPSTEKLPPPSQRCPRATIRGIAATHCPSENAGLDSARPGVGALTRAQTLIDARRWFGAVVSISRQLRARADTTISESHPPGEA